jgi:hypothetical protein
MIAQLPGVPALPAYGTVATIALDVTAIASFFTEAPIWGVFDDAGNLVFEIDSVHDLRAEARSRVSDFPIENGDFASYNKVQEPDFVRVRLFKASGGETARAAFLTLLDAAKKQTFLFSVVTPEKTYLNMNIEDYSYRRDSDSGANAIIPDVSFKEIREVDVAYTSAEMSDAKVKNPASADPVPTGKAQPTEASASTLAKMAGKTGKQSGATGSW